MQTTLAFFLYYLYNISIKGTTAHKMVDLLVNGLETPPLHRSSFGVVFLCLKHYLIYVNTNVSNARMNIPKAIRSLKSKCFISTTPILCRIEASHPATRLFLFFNIA